MSGSLSERPIPESSGIPLLPCCQDCPRQRECPYVNDQLLCHTACQEREAAQLLASEACRLQAAISRSGGICCLLEIGRDTERALSHALHTEMALIDNLCAQMPKPCP